MAAFRAAMRARHHPFFIAGTARHRRRFSWRRVAPEPTAAHNSKRVIARPGQSPQCVPPGCALSRLAYPSAVLLRFCRPSPPTPQWRYAFAQRSDAGMVRPNNEDAVHVEEAPAWSVAVLADGMGGYRAGEVASALAVKCITQSLQHSALKSAKKNQPPRMAVVHRALEHCVQAANTAVRTHAREHADCKGMGATVVAAVFTQDRLVLAHLGDSRAYLWRGAHLTQLTSDHSWLQEQIDAGQISTDAAAQSGLGHLVTRALGVSERARPTLREQTLEAGDRILLCSDGLSDLLAANEIAALLTTDEPLERQAEQLIARANALGGHDNISVILASVEAPSAD